MQERDCLDNIVQSWADFDRCQWVDDKLQWSQLLSYNIHVFRQYSDLTELNNAWMSQSLQPLNTAHTLTCLNTLYILLLAIYVTDYTFCFKIIVMFAQCETLKQLYMVQM